MKKTIFVLAFSLILTLSLCGSAFASETNDMNTNTTNTNVSRQGVENSSLIQSSKSLKATATGLTATATRVNSNYIRVVFKNTTSSKISVSECYVMDAATYGDTIVGPFSISVPAKGTKTYDLYVGNNPPHYYVYVKNYGTFDFNV